MFAKPTTAEAVKKHADLMLARDGSDRVEAAKGATAITIGRALCDAAAGEDVDAFIAEANREYLSAEDSARLDRTVDERRRFH